MQENKFAQVAETYNDQYKQGGYNQIYHLNYRESPYLPLFRKVLALVCKFHKANSILDVGCGNGAFGHLVAAESSLRYQGFDFSTEAIKLAKAGGPSEWFQVDDARTSKLYDGDFECLVCTEVLEHLENDLEVIANWPSNMAFVCSVPNFDSRYHERFFSSEQEVIDRYSPFLQIEKVEFVFQPFTTNLSFKSQIKYAVNCFRSRSQFKRVFNRYFRNTGSGWFVFSGKVISPSNPKPN